MFDEERKLADEFDKLIDDEKLGIDTINNYLRRNKVNLNFFPYPLYSFLYKAVNQTRLELVKTLLANGANVHLQVPLPLSNPHAYYNNNLMHLICHNVNAYSEELNNNEYNSKIIEIMDITKELLNHKIDINQANSEQQTPLMLACNDVLNIRDDKFINFLIDNKANVDLKNETGETALEFLARSYDDRRSSIKEPLISHVGSIMYKIVSESKELGIGQESQHFNFQKWIKDRPEIYKILETKLYETYHAEMLAFRKNDNLFNVAKWSNHRNIGDKNKYHPLVNLKNNFKKINSHAEVNIEKVEEINKRLILEKNQAAWQQKQKMARLKNTQAQKEMDDVVKEWKALVDHEETKKKQAYKNIKESLKNLEQLKFANKVQDDKKTEQALKQENKQNFDDLTWQKKHFHQQLEKLQEEEKCQALLIEQRYQKQEAQVNKEIRSYKKVLDNEQKKEGEKIDTKLKANQKKREKLRQEQKQAEQARKSKEQAEKTKQEQEEREQRAKARKEQEEREQRAKARKEQEEEKTKNLAQCM